MQTELLVTIAIVAVVVWVMAFIVVYLRTACLMHLDDETRWELKLMAWYIIILLQAVMVGALSITLIWILDQLTFEEIIANVITVTLGSLMMMFDSWVLYDIYNVHEVTEIHRTVQWALWFCTLLPEILTGFVLILRIFNDVYQMTLVLTLNGIVTVFVLNANLCVGYAVVMLRVEMIHVVPIKSTNKEKQH